MRPLTGDDSILPFQLQRAGIRGRVVRLDSTLDEILSRHRYPTPVAALVGEATLITALIGQAIKLRWKFSMLVRGDGPVRMIATDYYGPEEPGDAGRLRAYASFDADAVAGFEGQPYDLLGQGVFGLTIDQGPDMRPYQGITPLAGGSLGACAETYFAQSEQLATRFATMAAEAQQPGAASGWRAGGILIQQLPEGEQKGGEGPSGDDGLMTADDVAAMGSREEDWGRVTSLLNTVDAHELIGPLLSQEELLYRLFHEESVTAQAPTPVNFGCTCSADRVKAALAQYSASDIADMTNEEGVLTADCQFCGGHYVFDPNTLGIDAET